MLYQDFCGPIVIRQLILIICLSECNVMRLFRGWGCIRFVTIQNAIRHFGLYCTKAVRQKMNIMDSECFATLSAVAVVSTVS
jgi:hypothetical protein